MAKSRDNSLRHSLSLRDRVRLSRQVSIDRRIVKKPDVYRNILGLVQRLRTKPTPKKYPTHIVSFDKPLLNPVCIKRALRKRVLFAKGFAGKGKVKKAVWNEDSKISCKG